MSQINHLQTYGGNSSPTMEQLLREADPSTWSPAPTSPSFGKEHDPEEGSDHHHKKSVFTKVKEKARKLRHSLSNKKRHSEDENATPSWGYNLEEDEDEDDIDAEYLGAPMYESELAPEDCKENARQHPRADPVIAENHVLAASAKHCFEQGKRPINSSEMWSQSVAGKSIGNIKTTTETEGANSTILMKETPAIDVVKPVSPMKTLTETVSEKLAPVYSTVTDATHAIASKIHSLTVSASSNPSSPRYSPATPKKISSPAIEKTFSAPADSQTAKLDIGRGNIWDKGVSVKEYLMHKFEPGEDERALSQVLSEAMSPRKSPGDTGVVERMKVAVNSMMQAEETPKPVAAHSAVNSSSSTPVFTNTHQVGEEEKHERILQAN